jgi:Recombinase zinc beta ribbon domain
VAGSVRKGGGLLVGLLRCGHCGRRLKVLHHARRDTRYICNADMDNASDEKCVGFSNMRIDAAVSAEVMGAISPHAIDAALQLIADRERAGAERLRQSELALQQARYEERHARRQYDAIDPDNRLVAGELERRWNDRLSAVARLEEQIRNLQNEQPRALHDDERATLLALADDLPQIVVTAEADRLCLVLHWQGGDHTRLEVAKNRTGQNRWKTDIETVQLVQQLARIRRLAASCSVSSCRSARSPSR